MFFIFLIGPLSLHYTLCPMPQSSLLGRGTGGGNPVIGRIPHSNHRVIVALDIGSGAMLKWGFRIKNYTKNLLTS
jgi:hypothetical protein